MVDVGPVEAGEAGAALMRERVERVFAFLVDLTEGLPVPAAHKELLRTHLGVVGEESRAAGMSAVQVPLAVHAAISGEEEPALPVAAACAAFYLGLDLQDSILDDELEGFWRVRAPGSADLAAASLFGPIPHLSLDRLREQGTPEDRVRALARQFTDALLAVMAGQHEDLVRTEPGRVSLRDARTTMEYKSGSAFALLARSGATLATDDRGEIEAYAGFGRCYGTALQLINDVRGLWAEAASQDLLNGRPTFPIVHALTVLDADGRGRLIALLAGSRESAEHHDAVRALLSAAGSVRYADAIVRLYRERARKHLDDASPHGTAGRELRALLDGLSVLPGKVDARA